jgi:hypothetical protein
MRWALLLAGTIAVAFGTAMAWGAVGGLGAEYRPQGGATAAEYPSPTEQASPQPAPGFVVVQMGRIRAEVPESPPWVSYLLKEGQTLDYSGPARLFVVNMQTGTWASVEVETGRTDQSVSGAQDAAVAAHIVASVRVAQ